MQISAKAGTGAAASGANGAAGTIYLKQSGDTFGSLLVNGESITNGVNSTGGLTGPLPTTIFTNASYQFDAITVTNWGVFQVGTNATLDLTGCALSSDSTTNSITSRLIVGTVGSTVLWPDVWTNAATISWIGTNGISTTSDWTVASGGILTHELVTTPLTPLNIFLLNLTGNLTVKSNGAIWVKGRCTGATPYPGGGRTGGAHGGEGGLGWPATSGPSLSYGSVTNPVTAGAIGVGDSQGKSVFAGGVVILRATGTITVDAGGTINADGTIYTGSYGGGDSGGSINIQGSGLVGSGTISSVGSDAFGSASGGGGGGRIAVVLTNSATFGSVAMSAIGGSGISGYPNGGAGTIYLKGTNQEYGTLIATNNKVGTSVSTMISPYVTDAVVGDVQILGTAKLAVSSNTLTVYGSWSNAVATNAFSGGTVVLAGTSPATVWGGNTWSNLTITTAGKVVSFQTNVIQYVYGVPAWSNNVTLKSTEDGTYWKLFKPSWGATQDVGVVTVQWSDAMSNTGATFRAAMGSTVSDSRNWTFVIPKGTVFLLR